jgi:hypothetical protein
MASRVILTGGPGATVATERDVVVPLPAERGGYGWGLPGRRPDQTSPLRRREHQRRDLHVVALGPVELSLTPASARRWAASSFWRQAAARSMVSTLPPSTTF